MAVLKFVRMEPTPRERAQRIINAACGRHGCTEQQLVSQYRSMKASRACKDIAEALLEMDWGCTRISRKLNRSYTWVREIKRHLEMRSTSRHATSNIRDDEWLRG